MTVIASCATPASSSASSARRSIRFVRPPLKRETTTATERRRPVGVPSMTVYPSGTSTSPRTCSTLTPSGGVSSITAADCACGQPSNGSPSGGIGSGSGSGASAIESRRCSSTSLIGQPPVGRSFALRFVDAQVLQVLVVQTVAELIPLGRQVVAVLLVRRDLDRQLLDHYEAEAVDPGQLLRVVRQDSDRRQPEVGEDLVADAVVARVGGEAELEVGLDRVQALLLQLV